MISSSKWHWVGSKPAEFYKGIRIKADFGLHEQLEEEVLRVAPKGARILDFGAGEGALSQRLADKGFDLVSVDIDKDSFKAKSPKFIHLNLNDTKAIENFISENEEKFDVVLGIEVIEHIQNHWQYVRDLKRLVKPGGHILISTPNISSWYSRIFFLLTGRPHGFQPNDLSYGHINPIGYWQLRLILEDLGFDEIHLKPGGTLPLVFLPNLGKQFVLSMMGLALRVFMVQGETEGWCHIVSARRADRH